MPDTPFNECHSTVTGDVICEDCTGQSYLPTIPPHLVEIPDLAWDAGADFIAPASVDGDAHVQFSVGPSGGIVLGFVSSLFPRANPEDPTDIHHGWYTSLINSIIVAQPIESGELAGTPVTVDESTVLTVRRVGTQVAYFYGATADYDDQTLHYTSAVPCAGTLRVGAAQFASGDLVA